MNISALYSVIYTRYQWTNESCSNIYASLLKPSMDKTRTTWLISLSDIHQLEHCVLLIRDSYVCPRFAPKSMEPGHLPMMHLTIIMQSHSIYASQPLSLYLKTSSRLTILEYHTQLKYILCSCFICHAMLLSFVFICPFYFFSVKHPLT